MLGLMRQRKRKLNDAVVSAKPRNIPENVYMWGGSFWDPWRSNSTSYAQQQMDEVISQFKRSTRTTALRFIRYGSTLVVDAGPRNLHLELVWEEGQVVEIISHSRYFSPSNQNDYRTVCSP